MDDRELLRTAESLRQGVMRLSRRMRLERGEAGLTQQQFSALAHLRRSGPRTPGDLAAAERIQPQSLTRTLVSLEGAGLIIRQAHPVDGRSTLLVLTPAGLRVLDDDIRARDLWLATAIEAELTGTEQGLLRLATELMVRLAGSAAGTGPGS